MKPQQTRTWIPGNLLGSLPLLSATAGPVLIAASQTNANEATKGWGISYSASGGIAITTLTMGITDVGLANFWWSEFPSRTVCYAASDAQVREMRSILAQLNFSVPPKPERKSEPMPDKPDASLILLDMGVIVEHTSQNLLTGSPPDPTNPCAPLRAYTCSKLGNEDVNGRHTQKWEMKDTQNDNVMTVWIDLSLPWAVKAPSATFTSELRNLKEEPQPESLFQVPSDYRRSVAKD